MREKHKRLAPFVDKRREKFEEPEPTERRVITTAGVFVYIKTPSITRIYQETVHSDGTIKLEYLPLESLAYALEENRNTFRPLAGAILNFRAGKQLE